MREVEQYRELAEYLHKISNDFLNGFPWRKELSPAQLAVHRVSQEANVDCHNGFLSGIFQQMAKAKPFRLQHRGYHKISRDISDDRDNRKSTADVPNGVILRRITAVEAGRTEWRPAGRLSNEIRGTLYYKGSKENSLVSTCKVSAGSFEFFHPWYWEVPSVEEILKVFSFSEEKHINTLMELFKDPTAGTVMPEPEPVEKDLNYKLLFVNYHDGKKIPAIKSVREATGLGLKEAKEIVEKLGSTIKAFATEEEAKECKEKHFDDKAETMIINTEEVRSEPEPEPDFSSMYPNWRSAMTQAHARVSNMTLGEI